MSKVGVVGGGSWGSTLANVLADNKHKVKIYMRDEGDAKAFNEDHRLEKYLPGVVFNESIKASSQLADLSDSETAVFAIPSQSIRQVLEDYGHYFDGKIIVNVAKGIEQASGKLLSQVFAEFYEPEKLVVLSGPTHAEEVSRKIPSAIVSSSISQENMEFVQDIFINDYFRVYTNSDLKGVEIGGACKNVLALGIGILDGLGFGDNSRAAILTRGIHEITRLGVRLGAKQETFYGLSGIGDLIATATSKHSRNRLAGELIGKGLSVEELEKEVGMVVEGIKTTEAVYQLSQDLDVDMPITAEIYRILFEGSSFSDSYDRLMLREKKSESL